jgi:hypothetical protein
MTTTHHSKYFYGNEISQYGQQQRYLDYRTLAKAFDAVLVNDITKLFYASVNGAWIEVEQINGYIDNSEQIDELKEQIDELDDAEQITALEEQIDELEREQDEQPEIFQYYIVSATGAEILQEYTNDPLFYIDYLDMYIWGVTHFGTSWDYVLTDVKLEV